MKSKVVAVMLLAWVLCLGGCAKSDEIVDNTTEQDMVVASTESTENISLEETQEPEETVDEGVEEIPIIYDGDEMINLYLNRYNEVNADNPIKPEDFTTYHHHGMDHKNQIIFNEGEVGEVVISSLASGKIEVSVESEDEDDYRSAFFKYAKAYSLELSDKDVGAYWEQAINNVVAFTEFEEFELNLRRFDDKIEYFVISGEYME